MDPLASDGRCTTAVGSLELHWDYKGTYSAASPFHEFYQLKIPDLWESCFERTKCVWKMQAGLVVLVNYLDLTGSCSFSLFICALRVFSWFLDKGKWLIHDWCVVYMGGQRAGGTGCRTPCRWGALWAVKHTCSWCWSLGSFTNASAQHPLSPETNVHQKIYDVSDRICIYFILFLLFNYYWEH